MLIKFSTKNEDNYDKVLFEYKDLLLYSDNSSNLFYFFCVLVTRYMKASPVMQG